jgi:uncharacterized membrane protein YjjP (DUF1212 family)
MPITNTAADTPVKGFAGTIAGLVQETVEETAGARSIQKIMAEDANVAAVLIADPFEELSVNATVLAAGLVATFTPGAVLTYNSVKYAVQPGARKSHTPKFCRLAFTLRKPASLTYA